MNLRWLRAVRIPSSKKIHWRRNQVRCSHLMNSVMLRQALWLIMQMSLTRRSYTRQLTKLQIPRLSKNSTPNTLNISTTWSARAIQTLLYPSCHISSPTLWLWLTTRSAQVIVRRWTVRRSTFNQTLIACVSTIVVLMTMKWLIFFRPSFSSKTSNRSYIGTTISRRSHLNI